MHAHLQNQQNMQHLLLQEMMEAASGPKHTFFSGNVKTTMDYILMDVEGASMATLCVP